jgi:hypothetical protein
MGLRSELETQLSRKILVVYKDNWRTMSIVLTDSDIFSG